MTALKNVKLEQLKCGDGDEIELGKRTYVPYRVVGNCPQCGTEVERDFSGDYLNYPVVGVPFDIELTCHVCEEKMEEVIEFSVKIQLDFAMKLVGQATESPVPAEENLGANLAEASLNNDFPENDGHG